MAAVLEEIYMLNSLKLALAASFALAPMAVAYPVVINGSSTTGQIVFTHPVAANGQFSFSGGANNLIVTSSSSSGLYGGPTNINLFQPTISGTFTVPLASIVPGNPTQSASVTGTGTMSIFDGVNTFNIASVVFNSISTTSGFQGGLKNTASAALTGFTYGGSNNFLKELFHDGSAKMQIGWLGSNVQLPGIFDLSAPANQYSFSFQIESLPEPGFYGLLALGLSGLFLARRRGARQES
ncbi:MAG: hypothetical protein U0Q16_02170 [Bryobacteraceae bacterium]